MQALFNFGLNTFLLLIQESPVYTTWNPWLLLTGILLMSGGVARHTLTGDRCSHFLMVCSFESMWLGISGRGCWLPYPDCSLELVAPSSNINLLWREAEHMLDLKTLKRWGWNRQRGTGVWTCKQLLAVNLEINEEERLWRAGTSSNNPRPGLWVTSSLQEHGTECMELWFLLYLLY